MSLDLIVNCLPQLQLFTILQIHLTIMKITKYGQLNLCKFLFDLLAVPVNQHMNSIVMVVVFSSHKLNWLSSCSR